MLVAAVAPINPSAGTPTGTVTFMDGSTLISTVPLDASGSASLDISNLGRGQHSFSASYSGDTNFQASSAAKSGLLPFLYALALVRI